MLLEFSFLGGSTVLTFWVNAAMMGSQEEATESHHEKGHEGGWTEETGSQGPPTWR